jgi:hypothetical protein
MSLIVILRYDRPTWYASAGLYECSAASPNAAGRAVAAKFFRVQETEIEVAYGDHALQMLATLKRAQSPDWPLLRVSLQLLVIGVATLALLCLAGCSSEKTTSPTATVAPLPPAPLHPAAQVARELVLPLMLFGVAAIFWATRMGEKEGDK